MPKLLLVSILIGLAPTAAFCQTVQEIRYVSSADESEQSAMFFSPTSKGFVPLIVALHTWSGGFTQTAHEEVERWCVGMDWAYLHPDFRGPNRRPEATGSELVVKDIVSAVEYAKRQTAIDASSIYLVGTSGGGYTALVMAGRHPEIWAGVSAWVPISDLKAWYFQCKSKNLKYADDIVLSCGGTPGDSRAVDREYRDRSPLTYLAKAKGLKLHINAGIHDGHSGSVPISHSLLAFNEVADSKDKIAEDEIRFFVEKVQAPERLRNAVVDPSYGEKQPLFRRTSGNATVTIFNGGHELVPTAAICWIQAVHENRHRETP